MKSGKRSEFVDVEFTSHDDAKAFFLNHEVYRVTKDGLWKKLVRSLTR